MAFWLIALAVATGMLVRSRGWRARQVAEKALRLVYPRMEERLRQLERIISGRGYDVVPRIKALAGSSSPSAAQRRARTE